MNRLFDKRGKLRRKIRRTIRQAMSQQHVNYPNCSRAELRQAGIDAVTALGIDLDKLVEVFELVLAFIETILRLFDNLATVR